ncbi:MAG: BlaB/IND/MUS family subclass B1 metallo-beta-lactamase [Candidatus Kapaibacterium sp.]
MKTILSLALLFATVLSAHAQKEGPIIITRLAGNFYIYTTHRDLGGHPFPSNSLYVVTDSGVVMIDTPWNPEQTGPLLDSIRARHHMNVVICISTHHHEDRTAGLDVLKERGIPTYSTEQTLELCREKSERQAAHAFARDTTFSVGGLHFQTFYPGQGHSSDNIVVWFPKEKVLYGGCFIKSTEAIDLGNLADANISAWPASIKKMMRKFPNPAFIIPGHQGWKNIKSPQHTLDLLRKAKK